MKKSLFYVISAVSVAMIAPQAVTSELENAKNVVISKSTQSTDGFKILTDNIVKSPADSANYRGILLDNGMTVLLISDPKANKSLMSVALPIGSMEDPDTQQGLAHYLEHMVLMGSKKFPETNGLDHFLSKNGGRNNASTSNSRTAYYLEVNNNAFDDAAARLADALAAPLLLESNAKKELNAVNSEMIRAKSSDGYLLYSVELATANSAHPITKFTVGNKKTLSDKSNSKLQTELEQFYNKYYSANLVKAVLYSNQSLEKLAKLAVNTLGTMANKNLQKPEVKVPLYLAKHKGVMIHYKPIKPMKLLEINFDYPNNEMAFKSKTNAYLIYMFNNNTTGTLSDYLIKNGLSANGIQAGADANLGRNRGSFTLYIDLTKKGLAQKDKVISLVFQQIEALKKAGIKESYFKEMEQSLTQEFKHLTVEKHLGFVEDITDAMLLYPLENVINAGFIAEAMDKKAIEEKLNAMTLENARILLVSKNAKTNQTTPYMEAPYSVAKFTPQQKAKWLRVDQEEIIKLPELNPYFATDFSLNVTDSTRLKPQKVVENAGEKIYAMGSQYFPKEPKAMISLDFLIAPRTNALKSEITESLLNYMNYLALNKLAFQSSVAGIDGDLFYSENGISIRLLGYPQHFERLVKDALTEMKNAELKESDLIQAKQQILEALDRQKKENSLNQAVSAFHHLVSYPYFEREKQKKMVSKITLQEIKKMRNHLFSHTTGIEALAVGNLSDKQVISLTNTAKQLIHNSQTALGKQPFIDFRDVSQKVNYIQRVPNEDDALVATYLLKGNNHWFDYVRSTLLADIISRWYFNDLRTDKQLGYVVSAQAVHTGKTSGLHFMVQSPNTKPKGIMEHNQRFFKESEAKLQAMTEQEFDEYKNSLLEILQQKPESLRQEFLRFASDFDRNNFKFDHLEEIIKITQHITKQQVVDFYQQAVMEQRGFVFISQALGKKSKLRDQVTLKDFKTVKSIEKLQKSLPVSYW
ncbi:pitrilysin [Pasteurella skyensis]|uniref:Protease 3 n=2 Tax=Phocoenobacter skyensis TaxID=97481 RepID=A0A1H7X548_9PAST|nr:pitrilysin [Pasteurella skyensis]MDP8079584.1 pitrilysin [Pasteurella skyensis]MDP8085533.1 pitrilysin [Pasteurella skyensis]MDP8186110.1 pitrilysin [Pasteurella skyensis]SEM28337.1 protease-3 [Pasteurella skyensis]